ncbi:putative secreted protein with PEP-CTERM sorting signal [Roseiarcus fermentans]|uniref:Putative secreted protein with PEP-CTERM sorting signal n=1 Tax=Roseiarcus fermentans TaxID=1473586 RepID=A0A366EM33_9HYPH|nr:PEP-CTERM sorting domain-containing protein [Roseiarcus fermentans]RBP02539.1 putative secreted protein with PEP-CTERM sorting signal [Roseiarcus fermentans]
MRSVLLATAALSAFAAAGVARAATIDVFDFTQVGWALASVDPTTRAVSVGAAVPGGVLSGSFTGVVGARGLIDLADLSAFSATFSDTRGDTIRQTLMSTTLFSYDTTGGAPSLAIGGIGGREQTCVGDGVALAAGCSQNFDIVYPSGILGAALFPLGPYAVTMDLPTVTLVSSTPAVPEPPTVALVLSALAAALGFARWRRPAAAV